MNVDWGAGRYERTAAELEPVADALVERAALAPGERVLDLACGTGSVGVRAAAQSARVIGVDGAPRLLGVAREQAQSLGVQIDFRTGDLLALPVDDGAVDVVISSFGLIFAPDPPRAMAEVARVLAPGGRVLISAWIPAGPIDAMLAAMGHVLARVSPAPPPRRVSWSDATVVSRLAAGAGLSLSSTITAELAIRDRSAQAYVTAGRDHPMALAVAGALEQAGLAEQARDAMIAVLEEANEDPAAFLVHSPYVIHELSPRRRRRPAR
jgi:SAM-dependent methyltransferase